MPTADARAADLTLQVFGGRVTQFGPQALPAGASPFNHDVIFSDVDPAGVPIVGEVATRPGMQSVGYVLAGNPTVNYLRTFIDSVENFRQLYLDALGNMWQDFPPGTLTTIGTVVPGAFAKSDTLFAREWIAIGDGNYGIDIPRQWEGSNFDRVSQEGPGAPPIVADEVSGLTIDAGPLSAKQPASSAVPVNITSISLSAGTVTVVTAAAWGFGLGNQETGSYMKIAGAPAGYNGTFPVTYVSLTSFTYSLNNVLTLAPGAAGTVQAYSATFQLDVAYTDLTSYRLWQTYPVGLQVVVAGVGVAGYNGNWTVVGRVTWNNGGINNVQLIVATINVAALATSSGGSLTITGHIPAGARQLSVCFVTRQGYITKPPPAVNWTSAGAKRAVVSGIPIGPSNIVARILIVTPVITPPATSGPFFYLDSAVATPSNGTYPCMIILDNTTTSYVIDFDDTTLQAAAAATNLYNLLELGECSSTISYSSRQFWAGERNKISNFVNLTFLGGWGVDGAGNNYPLGWTEGAPLPGNFYAGGNSCKLAGDTPYWQDCYEIAGNGVAAIRGAISQSASQDWLGVQIIQPNISYSVRARIAKNMGLAQGTININLYSASAATLVGIQLTAAQVTLNYVEYTGQLTNPLATVPSDLALQIYASGTPTGGGKFFVACVEVYPTLTPYNLGQVRGSYANQPEAFDGVTGLFQVEPTNGQAVRTMFRLLDNKLYVVKERSLFVTNDDGQNEPALWTINTVSDKVGTSSVNGVDISPDGWAVIAAKDGLYIFDGSTVQKISQEIYPDWATINWNAANRIYVAVDHQKRRIHVGCPTGSATKPNAEFVLDYAQLSTAAEIADSPQAHYAYFNPTQVVAPGRARRWTTWNISMTVAAMTLRSDGSYHLLRGNAAGTGKIYDQVTGQLSDDGVAISNQYQTYFFPSIQEEQMLQLGAHGKYFGGLTGFVTGSGNFNIQMHGQNDQRIIGLLPIALSTLAKWDFEKNLNFESERASLLMGTNAVGSWFHLSKLTPIVKRSGARYYRGMN